MKQIREIVIDGIGCDFQGCRECPMNRSGYCRHPKVDTPMPTGPDVVRAGEVAVGCPAREVKL